MLQNICKNVLESGYMCNKTFYVHGIAAGSGRSKTFLQMFYFTCNHLLRLIFQFISEAAERHRTIV